MDHDRYRAEVDTLTALCLRRLPRMIDPKTGLFVKRVDGEQLKPSSTSVRYSALTGLGLARAEKAGLASSIDLAASTRALDRARPTLGNSGDLALVLWATAGLDRRAAERALEDLLGFGTLAAERDGSSFRSTELAWVVTGLAEAIAHDIGHESVVRRRLDEAYGRLLQNRGESGLLAFESPNNRRLSSRFRSTLGFFDAQVYSIVASLRHHAVTGDAAARDTALTMGRALLQKQRSRGQWPWHYEVATGAIVDPLPTYAVHQDAMAPMALLMLERETGLVATPAVARGLGWLFGDNELNTSLVDADRSVIWRSIRRRNALRSAVYPLKLARLAGAGPALADALSSRPLLAIDREFRPYHLGLCLYAFAELSASGDRKEQPSA